jgi:hypothetical protein
VWLGAIYDFRVASIWLIPNGTFLVATAVLLGLLVVAVWAFLSVLVTPEEIFVTRRRSKSMWILSLFVLTVFTFPVGSFVGAYFLFAVRPGLREPSVR